MCVYAVYKGDHNWWYQGRSWYVSVVVHKVRVITWFTCHEAYHMLQYIVHTNAPDLRYFLATEAANELTIRLIWWIHWRCFTPPSSPSGERLWHRDYTDALDPFLSAARSRSPRWASLRLVLRIAHFRKRMAEELAWARLVHNHDDKVHPRTLASVWRCCFDQFGSS